MSFTITLISGTDDSVINKFSAGTGETILDAALKNGVGFPYGCRNGDCGSCKGKIVEGKIQYNETPGTGISEQEINAGYALFCQASPVTDVTVQIREVNAADDLTMRKLPCRVTRIDKLNHNVIRLYLTLPSTERLQFLPGQYIDILLRNGKRRSFSLANAPHEDEHLELHIRHYDGGLFSEYAFHELKEKALLSIEGPLGSFFLRKESKRPIIMIAGGTGFAPIKSIIEHLLANTLQRRIYLYWGARNKRDLYLHNLALDWAGQNNLIQYVPVLSEPHPDDQWQEKTGLVHEAVLNDFDDLSGYEVYTCGPPPMVRAVRDSFVERGLAEKYIYSDAFETSTK